MSALRVLPMPSLALLVATGTVALVIIGSLAPWAHVSGETHVGGAIPEFSIHGTGTDGLYTLVLAIVAGVLVLWRVVRPDLTGFVLGTASILFLVSGTVSLGNWMYVEHIKGPQDVLLFQREVGVAWGLIIVSLTSWAGLVACGYQLWNDELR